MQSFDKGAGLHRDWLVVPAAVLLSVAVAAIYLAFAPRTYVATSNVFVSMHSSDAATTYLRGTFSTIRAQSYTALATSPGVLRGAIEQVDPGYPLERLAGQVAASVIPQTVLLQVTVSSENPDQAGRFADAVAQGVAERGTSLEQSGSRNDAPIALTPLSDVYISASPLSPSVARVITLAVLLGLFLGSLGLSAMRAQLARRGSESDLGTLAGLDVIGRLAPHSLRDLEAPGDRLDRVREQLRILRTNLAFLGSSGANRVALVTSPNPKEGRSTTALGLAISLAESSPRVLLIDGDLRSRSLSRLLGREDQPGITDVVLGAATAAECASQDPRGFFFLGCGVLTLNPADLLSSEQLGDIMGELAVTYDQIVIDTPPIRQVADAALWASHGGISIVVSRHARTPTVSLVEATKSLQRSGTAIAGVVVTATR